MKKTKLASIILGLMITGAATADPNNVYIEQLGNTNTVTIEQVGTGNNVGGVNGEISMDQFGVRTMIPFAPSPMNYATVVGNTNNLDITQYGDNNSAQYHFFGNDNDYISWLTGDNNQTNLRVGSVEFPSNLRNFISEWISGSNNFVLQEVRANDITDTIHITGSFNQVTNQFFSSRAVDHNTIVGNFNVINSQQTDAAGALGHTLTLDTTGDFNSITTQQQGFEDTNIDIHTVGNDNAITVRTSSASIVAPASAIMLPYMVN